MRFIDLFAGVGGFHLGLERANNYRGFLQEKEAKRVQEDSSEFEKRKTGFTCIWANEFDKYAGEVYQKRFPETEFSGADIRTVDVDRIPSFDLLCAGFPCQAFSIAGKRKGFEETRGTLFFEIIRIAQEKRPRLLLLENVKGLLSHDKGRTFATILSTLDEIGYDVEGELLNSKNFGVPQNRERVFIIGHLRGKSSKKIFPLGQSSKEISQRQISKQVASTIGASQGRLTRGMNMIELTQNVSDAQRIYSSDGIAKTLKGLGGGQGAKTGLYEIVSPPHGFYKGGKKKYPNIRANAFSSYNELLKSENRIRRLTPTECERLQGFPDNWTEELSDTQRYKCMGNAVTVNVVEAIGKKLVNP